MRELVFRGQTRRYGERLMNVAGDKMPSNWVYGGVFPNNSGGQRAIIYQQHPDVAKFPVYVETVGQYTGLPDYNRVKIFEDDILRVSYGFDNDCYYTVKFMNEYYDSGVYPFIGWCLVDKDGEYVKALTEWLVNEYAVEVVGNAFDNPELLYKAKGENSKDE